MTKISITVTSEVSESARCKQLCGMFDVPPGKSSKLSWHGDFPYESKPWNVGLIVGPSGCGKSTILRQQFGEESKFTWKEKSVIEDFKKTLSVREISKACQSVGFNTIPAWLRPFHVLSNGEKFRVKMARNILETSGTIVVDEFTSVVDRQVAKNASHSVQKSVRKNNQKIVVASCHHDIIDWLQPDWVLEPATMKFRRRSLRRRPEINVVIGRVPISAWSMFSKFHYMTAKLHRGSRCFGAWINGDLVSFAGVMNRPHLIAKNVMGVSRTVTLPDWQGLGIAFVLVDAIGAAYKALGKRLRRYPGHPAFIASSMRSKNWALKKKPGQIQPRGKTSKVAMGTRPSAVFEYCGAAMTAGEARKIIIK